MRILNVHNHQRMVGGAERASLELQKILRAAGHEVIPFALAHPDNDPSPYPEFFVTDPREGEEDFSPFEKLRASARIVYNREARRKFGALLRATEPDLIQLHILYDRLTASVLHEIVGGETPVVMTVHDYHLLCPRHILFMHGEPCERCAGGRFHHAISNRCVRDSYLVSTLRAFVSYTWKWSRIFERAVDIFVAPSRFMRDKLVEHGFDARRIVHLPYLFALPPEEALPEPVAGAYALYFGRLVASKGIETLIEAWKGLPATFPIPLKIAGTGPMEAGLREWIARAGITQIECLGHLTGKELERVVEGCRFVVYPSEWYENFPLVTYETYLAGKPILVSDRGGMPEMVDPGSTGLIFRAGDRDDLRQKILTLGSLDDAAVVEMGRNARMKLIEEYHPDRLYPRLMAIYEQAGEVRKTRKR